MRRPAVLNPSLILMIALAVSIRGYAERLNGFELQGALIPAEEILRGGPAKDGIPSIDDPHFVTAEQALRLDDSDMVIGVSRNGIGKAYPIRILNWHEVVNDHLGGEPLVITFCPLCGSGMVFQRRVGERNLTFGVSGLLYNSDVLLYDRQTESLWSQIEARAVTGEHRGQALSPVPVEHTSWSDWRRRHPDTLVLSFETGFQRNYDFDPYGGYEQSAATYFPVKFRAAGFHPKERVIGLVLGAEAKAWPFIELGKVGGPLHDSLAGTSVVVHFDSKHQSARILDGEGKLLPAVTLYWFAWAAFHPDTAIFRSNTPPTASE